MLRRSFNIILYLVLAALIILSCSNEQNSQPLFLYKVNDENSQIHLFGSIHVLRETDYPLDPVIEQTFINSENLILEVHPDSLAKPSTQQLMREKAFVPDAKPLSERLHKETYTLLKINAENLGIPVQTYQQVQPWFAALSITMRKLESLGFSPQHGIEMHFYQRALENGISIEGLETARDQIVLFDSLSIEDQDKLVMQSLIELAVLENDFQLLIDAWKQGQAERLGTLLLQSFKEYPDIYQALVVNRNKHWLREIKAYLQTDKSAFVVVGAAHLAGPDGLVNMLMEEGYTIKQLKR